MEDPDVTVKTVLEHPAAQPRQHRKICWAVQEGDGSALPLYFVLAGYGDAWVAAGLARALGPKYALYGVQPPFDPALSAKELGALYVQHLRTMQPQGPYCISGYSAGAVMALEMAVQLRAMGQHVGLIALLDPLFIRYTRLEHVSYVSLQKVCWLLAKVLPKKIRVLQILTAMFQDRGLDAHLSALAGHDTGPYTAEIVIYQARWTVGRSPFLIRQFHWFTKAPLRLETVPGDHHTFIRRPHVEELARRLRLELERARAGHF